MAWVVDTCLLIDIAENDAEFGRDSARLIAAKASAGLVISPVSYVEFAPVFKGDTDAQDQFLHHLGVSGKEDWRGEDTSRAHQAWWRYVAGRRAGKVKKRPIADVFIGAFASRHDGLLTRNAADFRRLFAKLRIKTP